jgi:hypothetical protein
MWADSKKQSTSVGEKDVFANINKIGSVKSRILIIHGNKDGIVHIRHS